MPGPWLEALGVKKIHYLPRIYNREQNKKKGGVGKTQLTVLCYLNFRIIEGKLT